MTSQMKSQGPKAAPKYVQMTFLKAVIANAHTKLQEDMALTRVGREETQPFLWRE